MPRSLSESDFETIWILGHANEELPVDDESTDGDASDIFSIERERERESRLLLDLLVYCACVAEVVTSEEVLVLFGRKLRLGQGLRS